MNVFLMDINDGEHKLLLKDDNKDTIIKALKHLDYDPKHITNFNLEIDYGTFIYLNNKHDEYFTICEVPVLE